MARVLKLSFFFFFNDTATTEIYTLSLHDALPISIDQPLADGSRQRIAALQQSIESELALGIGVRSEEHTSELQSRLHLVCRLLLEKKKTNPTQIDLRPYLRPLLLDVQILTLLRCS